MHLCFVKFRQIIIFCDFLGSNSVLKFYPVTWLLQFFINVLSKLFSNWSIQIDTVEYITRLKLKNYTLYVTKLYLLKKDFRFFFNVCVKCHIIVGATVDTEDGKCWGKQQLCLIYRKLNQQSLITEEQVSRCSHR